MRTLPESAERTIQDAHREQWAAPTRLGMVAVATSHAAPLPSTVPTALFVNKTWRSLFSYPRPAHFLSLSATALITGMALSEFQHIPVPAPPTSRLPLTLFPVTAVNVYILAWTSVPSSMYCQCFCSEGWKPRRQSFIDVPCERVQRSKLCGRDLRFWNLSRPWPQCQGNNAAVIQSGRFLCSYFLVFICLDCSASCLDSLIVFMNFFLLVLDIFLCSFSSRNFSQCPLASGSNSDALFPRHVV